MPLFDAIRFHIERFTGKNLSLLQVVGLASSPARKQTLEDHIACFTKAQASVAFSSRGILALHVEADAAAIDIGFTEFLNVHKVSSEHALTAKIGMHIDALNPPDLAVPPIAPFKTYERLAPRVGR